MKQMLRLAGALWLVCIGTVGGGYAAGHSIIGWPFNFFNFRPLPDDAPKASFDPSSDPTYNDLFPGKVGAFTLAWKGMPNPDAETQRLVYSYQVQYLPPSTDPHQQRDSVFVTATQFEKADVANLLVNPDDIRPYSSTENIFYALSPTAYVYKAINNDFHDYTIAFVNGRWNVTIECTNDQNLIAFVNQYRR